MEALRRKICSIVLASVLCALLLQGVTCQEDTTIKVDIIKMDKDMHTGPNNAVPVRGDDVHPTAGPHDSQVQVVVMPTMDLLFTTDRTQGPEDQSTQTAESSTAAHYTNPSKSQIITNDPAAEPSSSHLVECVEEAAVRNKEAVKLMLKTSSSCEENRAKIESVLEHLCGADRKLEIYQQDHTTEMILSGQCIEADAEGMTKKFNNDNIKDKVGVVEAVPVLVKHSRAVLVSILIAGLLLAALLIAGYLIKLRRGQAKGVRLAEESFQVDEPNQGNTLLSVAPLPPQEPLDKPTTNGESQETTPTNGHSAPQTQVADSQM